MVFNIRSCIAPLLAAGLASLIISTSAVAGSRYADAPPAVLSPNVANSWSLSKQSQRGSRYTSSRQETKRSRFYKPAALRKPAGKTKARKFSSTRRTPTRASGSRRLAPQYLPTTVSYSSKHAVGTIVIDTNQRYLYLVQAGGKAKRYGVGVAKPGFEWAGKHKVTRKAEWPSWRPPVAMIAREAAKGKYLPTFMEGGPNNPLGARALYLGSTLYRIHGTNQPWTIGGDVSSGCIRMRNEDVVDLYQRVGLGAQVVVL